MFARLRHSRPSGLAEHKLRRSAVARPFAPCKWRLVHGKEPPSKTSCRSRILLFLLRVFFVPNDRHGQGATLSERDICTKFITPALRKAGWDEMLQIREEVGFTKGRIIVRGKLVSRGKRLKARRLHPLLQAQYSDRHHRG